MNDLAKMIDTSIAQKQAENQRQRNDQDARFNKEMAALQPLMASMKSLEDYGFKVIMHTDKAHFPCPAIHVKSVSGGNMHYDYFGEVYITQEGKIRSGGCNIHRNAFENESDFLKFVADKVALIKSR
ncbi:hypothetical protein [Neptuniibacter sp. QD37_11]|uniref:hypothetical protein n=1 Tax=Neptuniibacter sp. QD37_11 TaxID=3398209 RepID=UPI0039F551AB